MIVAAPTPRAEMERRARRKSAARRAASTPSGNRTRNVEAVLSLDQVTFFTFRGRPFGVPSVPYRLGERLLALHAQAGEAARAMAAAAGEDVVDRDAMAEYFGAVSAMAPLIWAHCFPASRPLRILRALGLARNPFLAANDRELLEIADFFLACRMKSGVRFPSTPMPSSPPRATPSRTV